MSLLLQSIRFRDVPLRNRLVVSPMCQYSSEDGMASDWHLVHLGSRAVGGAGAVITEATAVEPRGRISPKDLGIWKDAHVPGLARIAAFVKSQGAVPGIQLAHAGRKASTSTPWDGGGLVPASEGGWTPLAPSAIPFDPQTPAPEALTVDGIRSVIDDFQDAARRALGAGFELAEVHAAHGYLLHQFLSPLANRRTDAYGGSLENRTRLTLEVVAAVRSVWPERLPVWVRLSATDWAEGGWDIQDSVVLARELRLRGADLIDCSSGGLVPNARIAVRPGYQVDFAERIKKEAGVATGAVGLITTAQQAEAILQKGQADIILLAREFLRDPYFPLHAGQAFDEPLQAPVQYGRAFVARPPRR